MKGAQDYSGSCKEEEGTMSGKEAVNVRSQKAALQKTLLASAMAKPASAGKIINAYGQEEVICPRTPAPRTLSLSLAHTARPRKRACASARARSCGQ